MSTVPQGLQALTDVDAQLTTAVTDLTAAVSAATKTMATLIAELAANEDPAVQTIAAHLGNSLAGIQAASNALNAAEPPAPAPAPAPSTGTTQG